MQNIVFDNAKHFLGELCSREHNWNTTGKSLRYLSTKQCVFCQKDHKQRYKEFKKAGITISKPDIAAQIESGLLYFGSLCKNEHNFQDGKSLRYSSTRQCVDCQKMHNQKLLKGRTLLDKNERLIRIKNCQRRWKERNIEWLREYERKRVRKGKRKPLTDEQKEARRQRDREHRLANPEKYRQYEKERRERRKEQLKLYRQTEGCKEKKRFSEKRRSALKRQDKNITSTPYSAKELQEHFALFECSCIYCGSSDVKSTIDHFLALSKGGCDSLSNIVPACTPCNSSKRNRDAYDWFSRQPFFSLERWNRIIRLLGIEFSETSL